MKIKLLSALLLVSLIFLTAGKIVASGFSLNSIGNLNTSGTMSSHWWYTGLNPSLNGAALANSQVDIVIDGTSYQTTADESGQWSFTADSELGAGDHTVSLTNSGSVIDFTLTLGSENVNWDNIASGSSGETLPSAGGIIPTILLTSMGGGLAIVGKRLWK
ncbi:MAG: Ig-like domain-containing protein [Patescibacteria group bacterium]|jgi:hypothetical protein